MHEKIKQLTASLVLLTTLAGCATVQPAGPDNEAQVEVGSKSRTKKVLLTIGGILVLGAIIANEANENVRDAVRDANRR